MCRWWLVWKWSGLCCLVYFWVFMYYEVRLFIGCWGTISLSFSWYLIIDIKWTVKSSAIVQSSSVMSASVCPNLNVSMPCCLSLCRVAYGKSSYHSVFSLELRIRLLLQIAIFTFKNHLFEGVISILISGQSTSNKYFIYR